jgi:hypothetical protein
LRLCGKSFFNRRGAKNAKEHNKRSKHMSQVVQLDTKTILITSDNESDLAEIIDFVAEKDRLGRVHSFLDFASNNKILDANFQFKREECYDRQDVH